MQELPAQEVSKKHPAGFWIRLGAAIMDNLILLVLSWPLGQILGIIFGVNNLQLQPDMTAELPPQMISFMIFNFLGGLAICYAYYAIFYTWKAATPGKLALGLRVYRLNTQTPPSLLQIFLREILGKTISAAMFFIGYLLCAFRADKRALHDLIADTEVVRENFSAVSQ